MTFGDEWALLAVLHPKYTVRGQPGVLIGQVNLGPIQAIPMLGRVGHRF